MYKPRYFVLKRGEARPGDLRTALDKLEIPSGEHFAISRVRPLEQAEMLMDPTHPEDERWMVDGKVMREARDELRKLLEAAEAAGIDTVPAASKLGLDPAANQLGHFAKDSETSRQAALMDYPRSGTQRWLVLRQVGAAGEHGMTRDELVAALQWPPNVVTPRVLELVEGDWLQETERTRTTRAGAEAAVLVITRKAYDKIMEEGR